MDDTFSVETLDTRLTLRIYAKTAFLAGIAVTGMGPMWFDVLPNAGPFIGASIIRMCGALLLGASAIAISMAKAEDPAARQDGLLGLAGAHVSVAFVAATQARAIWNTPATDRVVQALFGLALILIVLWLTTDSLHLRGGGRVGLQIAPSPMLSTAGLRSTYEEQIREAAGQEERNRLARDLHDSIKQQLFVIQTSAATVQLAPDGAPSAAGALTQIRTAAREAMTELEAMLDQLRARPLENVGLVEALRKQCEALGFRTGAHVRFEATPLPASRLLAPGAQQAIFRVAQEALANAGRHARAANVLVRLAGDRDTITLTIDDDGQGFDMERTASGMGLPNMRARADVYQGTVTLRSAVGRGTTVTLRMPTQSATDDDLQSYRRMAWGWAGALVVMLALAIRFQPIFYGSFAAVAAIFLARAAHARRELQDRRGGLA